MRKSCHWFLFLVLLTSCRTGSFTSTVKEEKVSGLFTKKHRIHLINNTTFQGKNDHSNWADDSSFTVFNEPPTLNANASTLTSIHAELGACDLPLFQGISLMNTFSNRSPSFPQSKYIKTGIRYPSQIACKSVLNPQLASNDTINKLEPHVKKGLLVSSLGLFLLPVLAGPIGIVFCFVGIRRIIKSPEKWKGKGWGYAGMVTGLLTFAIGLYLLLFALAFLL